MLHRRIVALALVLLAISASDAAATTRKIMATTGDLAPGEFIDARFTDLQTVGITSDGTAVIWGAAEAPFVFQGIPGRSISQGLWIWNAATEVLQVQIDLLGLDWRSVDRRRIAVGANGRIVVATESGTGVDRLLDCHVGEVGCTTLAMTGDTVAGLPVGWTLHRFTSIDLDENDSLVFSASIDTPDPFAASAVFSFSGEVAVVAMSADTLAEPSTTALGVGNDHVKAAEDTVVFRSGTLLESEGSPIGPLYTVLLARWTPTTGLEGLMVGGEPAPGGEVGATFVAPLALPYDFAGPGISFDVGTAGTTAFSTSMAPSGDGGLWACAAESSCTLRIREDDPIPDRADGSSFEAVPVIGRLFDDISVAPDGTIVFVSTFAKPVDASFESGAGIFAIDAAGAVRTLVRSADPVPETGSVFSNSFAVHAIGSQNRVLLGETSAGLFASEPDGQLQSVMRSGESVDSTALSPQAERVDFDASDAGVAHVALRAYTNLAVVPAELTLLYATLPEPGVFASFAACVLALASLARRRR